MSEQGKPGGMAKGFDPSKTSAQSWDPTRQTGAQQGQENKPGSMQGGQQGGKDKVVKDIKVEHDIKIKKLPDLSPEQVKQGFANERLVVFNDSTLLNQHLHARHWDKKNLLMMSSGDFDGMDLAGLAAGITHS